jgi:hypothetical protein
VILAKSSSTPLGLRPALRAATAQPLPDETVSSCVTDSEADRLFEQARRHGLSSLALNRRRGLNRVTGEVAESVAELLLAESDVTVFSHITAPGIHGVDLLFLCADESVLALEIKGTLRAGSIPRLTPSRLRQMSREWLNGPDNPAMVDWELEADDLYAGVMIVDLASGFERIAVSRDFESFIPVEDLGQLQTLATLAT